MVGRYRTIPLLVIALTMLSACAGTPPSAPASREPVRQAPAAAGAYEVRTLSARERAAAIAVEQIGVPYRYGGASPAGFDCSGLVHYAYRKAGRPVPRTTGQLWSAAGRVPADELREGDLLFFRFDGKMSHVGLYVGHGRFVHAPSSGKTVSVNSLRDGIYRDAFIRGGRL